MLHPISYYCDSPTIAQMVGVFGERFEKMRECDRALLLWACSKGHLASACGLISESMTGLPCSELPAPGWAEFQVGLSEDFAKDQSLSIHLIHALSDV